LSYERLEATEPVDAMAMALLGRAAYFAPGEPIPRELLLTSLNSTNNLPSDKAGSGGWLKKLKKFIWPSLEADDTFEAELRREKALKRLVGLGLLEKGEDGAVVLHRLLRMFVINLAGDEAAQGAVEETLLAEANRLNKAGAPGPLLAWQPHLRAVTEGAQERDDERAAGLCNTMGYHLNMIGAYGPARPYLERALSIREAGLGPEHPSTATSLNNLGSLLQDQGEYAAARPYLERALRIVEAGLGPEHPYSRTVRGNLARLD
jgi:tetratricopeptide (TPR) repeat protein